MPVQLHAWVGDESNECLMLSTMADSQQLQAVISLPLHNEGISLNSNHLVLNKWRLSVQRDI